MSNTSSTQPERKISAAEAAKLNGVSAKTLIRWANAGMPHYHFDRVYLFRQSEIDLWMDTMFRVHGKVHALPKRASGGER